MGFYWSLVMILISSFCLSRAKRLLDDDKCRIDRTIAERENDVMAPWDWVSVTCPYVDGIRIAQCVGTCRDPHTGEEMNQQEYRSKEVLHTVYLPTKHTRGPRYAKYDIPLACTCVRRDNGRNGHNNSSSNNLMAHLHTIAKAHKSSCSCESKKK